MKLSAWAKTMISPETLAAIEGRGVDGPPSVYINTDLDGPPTLPEATAIVQAVKMLAEGIPAPEIADALRLNVLVIELVEAVHTKSVAGLRDCKSLGGRQEMAREMLVILLG